MHVWHMGIWTIFFVKKKSDKEHPQSHFFAYALKKKFYSPSFFFFTSWGTALLDTNLLTRKKKGRQVNKGLLHVMACGNCNTIFYYLYLDLIHFFFTIFKNGKYKHIFNYTSIFLIDIKKKNVFIHLYKNNYKITILQKQFKFYVLTGQRWYLRW